MTPTARWKKESPPADAEPPASQLSVLIANETDHAVDDQRLEAAVRAALAGTAYAQGVVSVAIVSDADIHRLNRQFLEHDWPTDVITFPLVDEAPLLEGEIVVSHDTASENAADAGWSADHELTLYVIHGALHLAGYDDHAPADVAAMRRREAEVLEELGIRRSASDSRWTESGVPEADCQ